MGRPLSGTQRRVRRLEHRWWPPRRAATPLDLDRLTVAELEELEALTLRLHRRPNGRWDFSALDDAELERLRNLVAKAQAVLPHEQGRHGYATRSIGSGRQEGNEAMRGELQGGMARLKTCEPNSRRV